MTATDRITIEKMPDVYGRNITGIFLHTAQGKELFEEYTTRAAAVRAAAAHGFKISRK